MGQRGKASAWILKVLFVNIGMGAWEAHLHNVKVEVGVGVGLKVVVIGVVVQVVGTVEGVDNWVWFVVM